MLPFIQPANSEVVKRFPSVTEGTITAIPAWLVFASTTANADTLRTDDGKLYGKGHPVKQSKSTKACFMILINIVNVLFSRLSRLTSMLAAQ